MTQQGKADHDLLMNLKIHLPEWSAPYLRESKWQRRKKIVVSFKNLFILVPNSKAVFTLFAFLKYKSLDVALNTSAGSVPVLSKPKTTYQGFRTINGAIM